MRTDITQKKNSKQARGISALETTIQDLRYAFRILRASPGFTATVVLSLALGIGANTAIFTLTDAIMWRMLPVRNPEDLLLLARTQGGATGHGFTYSEFQLFHDRNQTFSDLASYSRVRLNVSVAGSMEPTAEGQLVSGRYFSTLGVHAVAGRTIGVEDDRIPKAHPVAMLSYGYWKRRFSLDPSILDKTISLCGTPFTVIGVTPPEFFGVEVGVAPDIFVPVMMQPAVMPASENLLERPIIYAAWLRVLGRLRPNVPVQQAAAEMAVLFDQIEWPRDKSGFRIDKFGNRIDERLVLTPASRGLTDLRRQFSQPLFILMAVVGVVLLIACANTANLLMARAAARRPEFAMRVALGAGRWRLMRQLLVESVLLAFLGGVCGLLLANWATQLLVKFISSGQTAVTLVLEPDLRILGFAAAVSLLTGILFGMAPAIRATRIDPAPALKSQGGRLTGRGSLRPGRVLAVFQVALSLLLLIGAGLFVRSLQKLNSQDAGFPRESVLVVRVEPKGSDQRNIPGTSTRLDRIYKELIQRVESVPGVRSASMAHFTPTNRIGFFSPFKFPTGEEIRVPSLMVYPNYFATLGIPIVAGRDFNGADLAENSPLVAVVNETFARRVFPGENVVGKHYVTRGRRGDSLTCEIIGVVKDSRYANLRGETPPVIYQPFLQTNTGRGQMVLHARVSGNPGGLLPRIREEVQRVDKDLPMFEVNTLAAEMDAALVRERLIATLSSFFGVLALLLAGVGLYGLLAFGVVQRTGEMGVRMALGAQRWDVLWMVLREALSLVLIGVGLGLPATLAAARVAENQISGLLFGLTTGDPVTIAAATGLLAAVAGVAAYLPARRASRVDPMVALRNE
jgi:predicted permease